MLMEADDADASAKKQALVTLEWKPGSGQGHYGSAKQGTGQGQGETEVKRSWLAAVVACCKAVSRCCHSRQHDTTSYNTNSQEHLDVASSSEKQVATSLTFAPVASTGDVRVLDYATSSVEEERKSKEEEEILSEILVGEDTLQQEACARIEENERHEVLGKIIGVAVVNDDVSKEIITQKEDKDAENDLKSLNVQADIEVTSDEESNDLQSQIAAKIYEDIVVEEHWIEDDNLLDSPPPSYAESQQLLESRPADVRVDLSALDLEGAEQSISLQTATEDSASGAGGSVPRTEAEVSQLVSSALDILWEMRRNGDAWQGASAPASYLAAGTDDFGLFPATPSGSRGKKEATAAASSLRAFRSLVYDLTGEMLTDFYGDDDNEEGNDNNIFVERPWYNPPLAALRRVSRRPPRMLEEVRPIIAQQVSRLVASDTRKKMMPRPGGVAKIAIMRRRPDIVDRVLFEELQEEEQSWVNYDDDELAVKLFVTDAILELLLIDTVDCFTDITSSKDQP